MLTLHWYNRALLGSISRVEYSGMAFKIIGIVYCLMVLYRPHWIILDQNCSFLTRYFMPHGHASEVSVSNQDRSKLEKHFYTDAKHGPAIPPKHGTDALAVRENTKSSSTFSATNISNNMIWFFQLHYTIKMKSNHTGINYNHNNTATRNHIMIYISA